ncbi:MAG: hypothetical protein RLZZ215_314 [Pseudomonadota bacterium]
MQVFDLGEMGKPTTGSQATGVRRWPDYPLMIVVERIDAGRGWCFGGFVVKTGLTCRST